jgi:transitional endoplasmic reticulum ATPase
MEYSDTNDTFFCKVALNLLKDFTETYSEYSLLHRFAHDSVLEGPWFLNLRKAISDAVATDKSMLGVSVVRSLVGRKEVQAMVEEIYEAYPDLRKPVLPRETSKTLGELLELSTMETLILDSACRFPDMPYTSRSMLDSIDMRFKSVGELYACLFGFTAKEGQKAQAGILFNAGIMSKEGCAPDGLYGLNSDLSEVFQNKNLKIDEIDAAMFPHMLKTELTVEDYPHLSKEISRCIDIVEANQKKGKEAGINLMFWGLPGCGKTELAVAMARSRGWNLKVIGDISADNLEENSRASRLTSLKLATKIFRNKPKTVLLFDEMEDLFKNDNNAQFSKAFINRIIETTNIPIIWTTNSLEALGQPVLRRMVYNIGFEIPPEEVRAKMWQKYADHYKVKVDSDAIKKIAKIYKIAPALIKNAMHVTSTAFGRKKVKSEDLTEIVGSLDTLVNYGWKNKKPSEEDEKTPSTYDLSCAKTDHDLESFTDRLVNAKSKGFALCMYGPPGTGKSEYGRYLAHKMGKEVLFKRASDLQSMWVGECEKNIAAAFAEAKKKGMVLLIDEGDTFLRDRTKARQSWEVSQVNEMLSQMERHPEPFILTTNLMKDLDAASLRRFTFKLKFDYMDTDQSKRLFKGFFNTDAPKEIETNTMLVPGDYANVARQVEILGITDADEIYKMLHEETKMKPGHRNAIGIR